MAEAWLRGPMPGLPVVLQPAAFAFIAAREDAAAAVAGLTPEQLWQQPGGAASIGFHLFHLAGSTGRLLAWARGEDISDAQRATAKRERTIGDERPSVETLLAGLDAAVDDALRQLAATPEASLSETRAIGKAQLPSTTIGVIFHAAEHASRHAGQIVTTAKVVRAV